MPFESISPNMNLILPGVGQTLGPQYATDLNNSLTLIDQHNHTAGYGVPVPSSGLNINADLTMGNNNLIGIKSLRMTPQSILAGSSDLDCLFVSGVDLYYNDGLGNHVRITQSGGVAGSPGSISNLTSPASASYVAGTQTFVWQSNANTPANMDNASIILRNLVANSFGLTLQPPAAMGSNTTITLPTIPASQKIMTLDNSGNMSAPYTVGQGLEISANVIQVPTGGITQNLVANTVQTKTTNYTITTADSIILVDTTTGDINITLPTAVGNRNHYQITKISTNGNRVFLLTTSAQTINGAASGTPQLSAVHDSMMVQSDNANYQVASEYLNPLRIQSRRITLQTIGAATTTQVALNSSSGNGFTFSGNQITIKYDGFYDITGNLKYTRTAASAGASYQLFIYLNGTVILGQSITGFDDGATDIFLSAASTAVGLLVGDVVALYTRCSANNQDLETSSMQSNSLGLTRVGVIGEV